MIIKKSTSAKDVKAVLCHPEIYDAITDDNCQGVETFEPPITSEYRYIVGYVEGAPIGVMVYHSYRDGNKCHVQVLPEYRKEYAIDFGEQALSFRGTLPLYAEIPDLYKNVLAFALLNNFKVIDTKKDGHIKNGITYNVNVLEFQDGIC